MINRLDCPDDGVRRRAGRIHACHGARRPCPGQMAGGAPIPQGANEVIGAEIDGQVLVYGGQDPGTMPWASSGNSTPGRTNGRSCRRIRCRCITARRRASAGKFYVLGGFRLPDSGKVGWYPENKAWVFDLDNPDMVGPSADAGRLAARSRRWPSARKST